MNANDTHLDLKQDLNMEGHNFPLKGHFHNSWQVLSELVPVVLEEQKDRHPYIEDNDGVNLMNWMRTDCYYSDLNYIVLELTVLCTGLVGYRD